MYYCCKGCDECCSDCCHGCEQCCGEYCDAISECFSTPFSFCTLMSSFITIVPFILMIIAIIQSQSFDCREPIKTHLILQGICNLLNFLFCLYLMCQYGRSYDNEDGPNKREHGGAEENNICQRTINLILYDFVVCFYIFFLVFFVVWLIIGFNWRDQEPSISLCYQENGGFLMTVHLINLLAMIFYLVVGFIVFFYIIMIYACDDGSCSCDSSSRCLCLILTCGICDLGRKNKQKYSNAHAAQNRQQYKPERGNWIASSKRVCGCLSLTRPRRQQQYQNGQHNNNINNMHQQAVMNHPPQVQPQPQRRQSNGGSCLDFICGKKKPSQHAQQPQYIYNQPPPPPPPPQYQQQYNPQPYHQQGQQIQMQQYPVQQQSYQPQQQVYIQPQQPPQQQQHQQQYQGGWGK